MAFSLNANVSLRDVIEKIPIYDEKGATYGTFRDPGNSTDAVILLTDKCNLSCKYCYSTPYRSGRVLKKENCQVIIKKIFQNAMIIWTAFRRRKCVHIYFHGGGEPTLAWDELVYCIQLAEEQSVKFGIPVKFKIASNGTFSEEQMNFMIDKKFEFRISLDGIGEINDKTRLGLNNKSCFENVAHSLDCLNMKKCCFSIAAVVTEDNIGHMKEFAEYCINRWKNVKNISFAFLDVTESSVKYNIKPAGRVLYLNELYEIITIMIRNKIGIYDGYQTLEDYIFRSEHNRCASAFMELPVYNTNGSIVRCGSYPDHVSSNIGQIMNNRVVIDKNKCLKCWGEMKQIRPGCEDCLCSEVCEYSDGSCIKQIEIYEEFCDWFRQRIKDMLILIMEKPEMIKGAIMKKTEDYMALRWKI